MKKRILSLTLASALLVSNVGALTASADGVFEDIKVNKPYINGYTDGTFKPISYVNRAEVAKMIAVIESLEASATNFPDVGEDYGWAKEFIGSAEKAGILKGDQLGNFRPQDGLTRAEMATIVSRVIETPTGNSGVIFSDISNHWAEADIMKVANAGIINGYPGDDSTFTPDGYITRQEAVKMLNGMIGRVPDPEIDTKVNNPYSDIANEWGFKHILAAGTEYKYVIASDGIDSIVTAKDEASDFISIRVHATGSNEITIEGLGLNKIKLSEVKVANNEVKSVKVSQDGKLATLELKTMLEPNKNTEVVVNQSGNKKTYIVKYEIAEENLELVEDTFDQNKKGQTIGVKLDGKLISVDSLKAGGYSLEFEAYNGNESANYQVFGSADASTTGVIGEDISGKSVIGKYDVVLTLKKGDVNITSKRAAINIVDLNIEASSIKSVTLLNDSGKRNHDGMYAFEQASNTLVVGEELKVDEVVAIVGREEVKLSDSSVSIESNSNPIEIEGDGANRRIVAKGVGEAKVTISVGKATKVYDLKVVNEDRVETKVEAINKTNGILVGKKSKTEVKVTDQFGDPIRVFGDDTKVTYPVAVELSDNGSVRSGDTVSLNRRLLGTIGKDGKVNIDLGIAVKEGQTGSLIVKNGSGTIIGNIFVRSESSEVKSRKLEIDTNSEVKKSDNNILSLTDSKKDSITYVVKGYNSYGTYIEDSNLEDFIVDYDQTNLSVKLLDADGNEATGASINTAGRITGTNASKVKFVAKNTVNKTTVTVSSASNIQIGKENLTIEGSQSILQGIRWKAENIVLSDANVGYIIDKDTVLNLSNAMVSGGNQSIDGLVVSGSQAAHPKRIRESAGKLAIYLDKNNNGFYESGDEMIGYITMNLDDVTGVTKGTGFTATVESTNATGKVVYELKAMNADGTEGSVISSTNVTFSGNIEQSLISLEKDASTVLTNVDATLKNATHKGNIDKTIAFGEGAGLTVAGITVTPAKSTFVSTHTKTTIESLEKLKTALEDMKTKPNTSAALVAHYQGLIDRADAAIDKLKDLDKTIFDLTSALTETKNMLGINESNKITESTINGFLKIEYDMVTGNNPLIPLTKEIYESMGIEDISAEGVWSVGDNIKDNITIVNPVALNWGSIKVSSQDFNKAKEGTFNFTLTFIGRTGKTYVFETSALESLKIKKSVVVAGPSNLTTVVPSGTSKEVAIDTSVSVVDVWIDGGVSANLATILAKAGANPTVTVSGNDEIASAKIDAGNIILVGKTTTITSGRTVNVKVTAANGESLKLIVTIG